VGAGDAAPDMPSFHRYTSIENIGRNPNMIPEGTRVRMTEKIHGTNVRMGFCKNDEGWEYVAGSHKVRRKEGVGLYWQFFSEDIKDFLHKVSYDNGGADVVLFGEIFGPGVQDMQYGLTEKGFRAFDMSINGSYVDGIELSVLARDYDIAMVPTLYMGAFSHEKVAEFTDGKSNFPVTGKFKGREGIVITPVVEQMIGTHSNERMILKSVSVDYLNRKGATDDE